MQFDTVAAISTPYGKGGVAVIRISGDRAVEIAERVFSPASGKSLSSYPARQAVFGEIRMPDGERLDTGLCTLFRAPASFTGEDTAELACHGGILVTTMVLTACLTAGARQAEAGEFTRRAFLSGKLGLSAAEALGSLLEAQTGEQVRLSGAGMRGVLTAETDRMYGELRRVLASVFARIDYPDEDLADLSREEMRTELCRVQKDLQALAATYRTGHAIAEGIPTVIVGKTNAGKSSLYNRLTGHDAAIVTDIAGTTRDVLTETVSLGRVTLRLSDTAGIREAQGMDAVEKIGVTRALAALERAELVLFTVDATEVLDAELEALCERIAVCRASVVVLLNKCDAGNASPLALPHLIPAATVRISAKTGDGMDALRETVERLFIDGSLHTDCDAILSTARQNAAVLRASNAIGRGLDALDAGFPLDLSCADVEDAMEALSELDGRQVSEDIVSEIFSKFCVGK